jgi:putative hydrolase of the HAD superfamily
MRFDLIALDADDTLWHNEKYYRNGRETFNRIVAKYGVHDPDEARLDDIEIGNLRFYGYGAIGFAVSLAEAAMQMTGGRITSEDLIELLRVSKTIISADVEVFDGVDSVIRTLAQTYPLMLITKGNELHQASKIKRSELAHFFEFIEIVADKTPATYTEVLGRAGVPAERFIMVGNAMRSDIIPVLAIGGSAVYVHNELTWAHEQADLEALPEGRFFELETIEALPPLIQSLEG